MTNAKAPATSYRNKNIAEFEGLAVCIKSLDIDDLS
jgi:hypothetical protein